MLRYANPKRFMDLSGAALPWLGAAAAIFLGLGLYLGFAAPPDYQQGEVYRIIYIHPQTAYIGMMAYTVMAVAAAISLFGFKSGAALATVVGVLIEVPVMLSIVGIVNRSRAWYESGAAVRRAAVRKA